MLRSTKYSIKYKQQKMIERRSKLLHFIFYAALYKIQERLLVEVKTFKNKLFILHNMKCDEQDSKRKTENSIQTNI